MANETNTEILLTCRQEGLEKIQSAANTLKNTFSETQKILSSMTNFNMGNFRSLLSGEGNSFGGANAWDKLGKSIKDTIKSLSPMSSSMKKAATSTDTATKSIKNLGNAVEETEKKVDKAKGSASKYGEVWEKVGKELTKRAEIFASYKLLGFLYHSTNAAIEGIVDLQTSLANIQAITGATSNAMLSLSGTIDEVASSSRYSTKELADTVVVLGQAGYSAKEIEKVLPAINALASATGTTLATSVNVATSILSVFNLEASNTTDVVNAMTEAVNKTKADIGTLANGMQYAGAAMAQMGVSYQETLAVMSAVTNAGVKQRAVVGTGLRALATELTKPTKSLRDQLANVGLTMDDVDISTKGLVNVLHTLKDAGFGATQAFKGFERRAASFYVALASQLDTVDELRQSFVNTNAAMEAQAIQMDTISAQSQIMKNNMLSLVKSGFEPLVDVITQSLKFLNGMIGFLQKMPAAWKNFISILVTATVTMKTVSKLLLTMGLNAEKMSKKALASAGSVKKLGIAIASLGKSLKGMLIGGASIAAIWAFFDFLKSTTPAARLEILNDKLNEHSNTMGSLSAVYTELVSKQELYSNDSAALTERMVELSKQFEENTNVILNNVNSYSELTEAIRSAMVAEETMRLKDQQNKTQALRDKQNALYGDFSALFPGRNEKVLREIISNTTPSGSVLSEKWFNGGRSVFPNWLSNLGSSDLSKLKVGILQDKSMNSSYKELVLDMIDTASQITSSVASEKSAALTKEIGMEVSSFIGGIESSLSEVVKKYTGEIEKNVSSEVVDAKGLRETEDAFYESIKTLMMEVETKVATLGGKEGFKGSVIDEQLRNLYNTLVSQLVNVGKGIPKEYTSMIKNSASKFEAIARDFNKASGLYTPEEFKEKASQLLSEMEVAFANKLEEEIRALDKEMEPALYDKSVRELREANQQMMMKYAAPIKKTLLELELGISFFSETIANINKAIRSIEVEALEKMTNAAMATNSLRARQSAYGMAGRSDDPRATILAEEERERSVQQRREELKILSEQLSKLQEQKSILSEISVAVDDSVNRANEKLSVLVSEKDIMGGEQTTLAEIDEYETLRNEALANRNKVTTNTLELEKKILEVTRQIVENEDALGEYNRVITGEDSTNVWESIKTGAQAWNSQTKAVLGLNDAISRTTVEAIDSFSTHFSDAVLSIAQGAASIKDVFRDMAISIIKDINSIITRMWVQYVIQQLINGAMGGGTQSVDPNASNFVPKVKPNIGMASGGPVYGGIPNKDSVPAMLMPGEYVLNKKASSILGESFLNSLNTNTAATMQAVSSNTELGGGGQSVVNVWVVSDANEAQMGPNDVIATISKDIRTGGQTRTLIKSVMAGKY